MQSQTAPPRAPEAAPLPPSILAMLGRANGNGVKGSAESGRAPSPANADGASEKRVSSLDKLPTASDLSSALATAAHGSSDIANGLDNDLSGSSFGLASLTGVGLPPLSPPLSAALGA